MGELDGIFEPPTDAELDAARTAALGVDSFGLTAHERAEMGDPQDPVAYQRRVAHNKIVTEEWSGIH